MECSYIAYEGRSYPGKELEVECVFPGLASVGSLCLTESLSCLCSGVFHY